MSTLYIMSGLPFSGKSTLSKQIADILGIKRISFDEVWIKIESEPGAIPGTDGVERWKYISQICETEIISELKNNKSIIYDNLGDNVTNRDKMMNLAKSVNANFKIIYVDVSKEEVVKRRQDNLISAARSQVSDQNFNNALANFIPPSLSENPIVYTPGQDVGEWVVKSIK